jgi:hypothetical protein
MAIVQVMKKAYPSEVNLFMFKSPTDIATIMGKTAEAAVVTELQDAYLGSTTLAALGGSGGAFAQGNTFIAGVNYTVASVAFPNKKTNSPTGSLWCEMRNWNATTTTPTDLVARTDAIDVSGLPGSKTWMGFQWRTQPEITAGKTYAIFQKVDFPGGANNVGQYYTGDSYGSGLQIYQLYAASAWNTAGNDFGFKSYGQDA